MHIAVLIKQVPDTDNVKLDPETGTMIREGSGTIINPLDLNALEAAVKIKSRIEEECLITTISMGPPSAEYALRESLALGADEAFLLTDRKFAGADSWATSKVISEGLKKAGNFDLILAGEKATDGETGQVGPEVAAMLNIPCSTYISGIEIEQKSVVVTRSLEDGYERQRIKFPCLLTVLSALNNPSMPTLKGKKMSRRAEITKLTAEDIDIRPEELGLKGSPTRVVKVSTPKKTRNTKMYKGSKITEGIKELFDEIKGEQII
ncbi:MAG TPA: electron transfer flavoprotein subunit beta/FixA family protein [Thermotogota bacterium]|nr:electron transfer flavoprotein subunit beta/FixA family protein [Thermotogota bacterium]HPJ89450.1 electron transfer flavoprotein subunit beta/FixA family protein [Thermotogota bacterium]HPR95275.1 electron transfer flavoprotein subunit beta/FixA family protein [Thermotogota bacterium]